MMILWISCMFLGTLCAAQSNIFSQSTGSLATSGGSPFSTGGSASVSGSQFNPFPGTLSSSVSGSTSAGPSGTSASASASTTIITPPQPYPACLSSNPPDAVTSQSRFAYALLEASFTNPSLIVFYNTSFSTAGFNDAINDQVSETLPNDKSRILAGSLALIFETAYPRITPLLNAVSITNALSEIQGEEAIVISDDKEDYIEPFLASLSKAVAGSDGSADAQAQAVVSGILNYLDEVDALTYSKFNEFNSILAGQYALAIYSTCKPSTYDSIPKP